MNEHYESNDITSMYLKMLQLDFDSFQTEKAKFGLDVFDIANLSYDSFTQKREKLKKLLVEAGFSDSSQTSFVRSLSDVGARAFSECMAQQSKGLISAWVSKCTGSRVVVTVKTGFGGEANVGFNVSGAETIDRKTDYSLRANSQVDLEFDVSNKKDFLVTFNAEEKNIKYSDAVSINLDSLKRFEIKYERKTLTATFRVGAGCQGNTSGCQINGIATIVAPSGYSLLPQTLAYASRAVAGGPGVNQWSINTTVTQLNEEPYKIDIASYGVDGKNAHTQGIEDITYQCEAQRMYIEASYL